MATYDEWAARYRAKFAPYEVPSEERERVITEGEVGQYPGDSTEPYLKSGRKQFEQLATERLALSGQVKKAREKEKELHPHPKLERFFDATIGRVPSFLSPDVPTPETAFQPVVRAPRSQPSVPKPAQLNPLATPQGRTALNGPRGGASVAAPDGGFVLEVPEVHVVGERITQAPAVPPQQKPLIFTDKQGNVTRTVQPPKPKTSIESDIKELGRQVAAGAVVDVPRMGGQALQAFSPTDSIVNKYGKELAADAKLREAGWAPDLDGRGDIAGAFIRGGRAIAPSLSTMAAYLNPYGAVTGPLATVALFGGSQYTETHDKVKEAGGSDDDARNAGLIAGAIQGGGEVASNWLALRMFGAGKGLATQQMQRLLGEATSPAVIKPWLKSTASALVGEPATEIAQDVGTALTERQYGVKTAPLELIAKDSGSAAVTMTLMLSTFGLHGHYRNATRANAIDHLLTDPNAASPEERAQVVQMLHDEGVTNKIPDADRWLAGALQDVAEGKPVRRTAVSPVVTPDEAIATPAPKSPVAVDSPFAGETEKSPRTPEEQVDRLKRFDELIRRQAAPLGALPPELAIRQQAPFLMKHQQPMTPEEMPPAPSPVTTELAPEQPLPPAPGLEPLPAAPAPSQRDLAPLPEAAPFVGPEIAPEIAPIAPVEAMAEQAPEPLEQPPVAYEEPIEDVPPPAPLYVPGDAMDEDMREAMVAPMRREASVPIPEQTAALPPQKTKQGIAEVPVEALSLDPDRFQYKIQKAEGGETGSLTGVKKYDPNLAGIVQVWQSPEDGKTYVVNGHNRVMLAKRLGAEDVAVRYLNVETAEEARQVGALTNIAEGRGTPIDAAKLFRETQITKDDLDTAGIPMREKIATDGLALSQLDDGLFARVAQGDLSTEQAVVIGDALTDHAQQRAVVQLIDDTEAKGKAITVRVVRELTEMVNASPTASVTQNTLFGEDTETQSLAIEKAKFAAEMHDRLSHDKRLFGLVSKERNVKDLSRAGNVIKQKKSAKESQRASDALDVFDRLKHTESPISAILNQAVRDIHGGSDAKAIKQQAYADILNAIPGILRPQTATPARTEARSPVEQPTPSLDVAPAEQPAPPASPIDPGPAMDEQAVQRVDPADLHALEQIMQKPENAPTPVQASRQAEKEGALTPDFALSSPTVKQPKPKAEDHQPSIPVPAEVIGSRPIIGRETTPEEAPIFSKAAQEKDAEQSDLTELPEVDNSPSVKPKDPWERTQKDLLGAIDRVDKAAANWDEEGFQQSKPEYKEEPKVIHRSDEINFGYLFGEPNTEKVKAHYEYSIGEGTGKDEGRYFLLAKLVTENGRTQKQGAVGEYAGTGNGIEASHRKKGAGRAFFKELMNRGIWEPEGLGYSPGGLAVVKSAHRSIIRDAIADGKPVPPEVLADYPDLQPQVATPDAIPPKQARVPTPEVVQGKRATPIEPSAPSVAEAPAKQKEPWERTQKEFIDAHRTGFISSDAYQRYKTSDGIDFIKKEKYRNLVTTKTIDGKTVEIRESGEPLQYVKYDENDDLKIIRDKQGLATYLTDKEAMAKGLPTVGKDLAAFVGETPIGFASNEFGTAGVWVVEDWQKKGIGRYLLNEFMKRHPHIKKIGQMTNAGENMTRAYHKDMVREAIADGKPVPPEVLADYPDLQAKVATPEQVYTKSSRVPTPEVVQGKRATPIEPSAPSVTEPAPLVEPKKSRVSALREVADRLAEKADEGLNRDRQTNTARRARMVTIEKPMQPTAQITELGKPDGRETQADAPAKPLTSSRQSDFDRIVADIESQSGRHLQPDERGAVGNIPNKVPVDNSAPEVSFDMKEIEARYKAAAKGIGQTPVGFVAHMRETVGKVAHGMSRQYIDLPDSPRYAGVHEALRQLQSAPSAAKDQTIRLLDGLVTKMGPKTFDLFTRKVVLDDLQYEVDRGHSLPFGLTAETFPQVLNQINAAVKTNATIQAAMRQRKALMDAVREKLVAAKILKPEANNSAYFHHQVLEYAMLRAQGQNKALGMPKPGYAKTREGSTKDINANYLEAEFEFLHRALIDLKTVDTLKKIEADPVNLRTQLEQQATALKKADPKSKATWRDLIPEGYTLWQPDKGNVFFTAQSVSERAVAELTDRLLDPTTFQGDSKQVADALTLFQEKIRPLLAIGQKKHELVIPDELASTLDKLRPAADESLWGAVFSKPLSMWKQWVLINPRRWLKYNLNNLSGDLDAVIAGNPKVLRELPRATYELWAIRRGQIPATQAYKDAVERGVFDSGLTIQEIPEINLREEFQHLGKADVALPKKAIQAVWRALKDSTQFRENMLRYAAYQWYAKAIANGERVPYGASKPEIIDALTDPKDKAAKLSRELLIDYGAISAFGKDIRNRVIPFYSWMEGNTKRYAQLIENAFSEGIGTGIKTGAVLTGGTRTAYTIARMGLLYAMVQTFNSLFFSDEEDDLSTMDQQRLHVNLGRDDTGKVQTIRFQGALSDFLGWIGFEELMPMLREVEAGRATPMDVVKQMAKAPVNKVLSGATPVIKEPVELITGRTYYPDAFNPRPIDDEWRHFLRLFSLEHEYDATTGKPARDYLSTLKESLVNSRDPAEIAYSDVRALKEQWLQRQGLERGFGQGKNSNLLRDWKRALKYKDESAIDRLRPQVEALPSQVYQSSMKSLDPLAGLSKERKTEFLNTLSPKERRKLEKAYVYYRALFSRDDLSPKMRPKIKDPVAAPHDYISKHPVTALHDLIP